MRAICSSSGTRIPARVLHLKRLQRKIRGVERRKLGRPSHALRRALAGLRVRARQ